MAHHLEHGSADSQGINGTDPHQHKAHVAHGTAGNPAFHVVLGEGVEGAVNDVHDPKDHQGWRQGGVRFRKHLHVEAQQGVAAHLEEHPCQQHRHRSVGLTVGIGQPGVEREHRQFHAEANQETHVTQQAEAAAGGTGRQFRDVEGERVTGEGQCQAADQDQQRGQGRVKDEFGGGVLAVLSAPDGNQQVDGNQFQLPGQEEEQEVLRQKHQALGRGLNKHQGEVQP